MRKINCSKCGAVLTPAIRCVKCGTPNYSEEQQKTFDELNAKIPNMNPDQFALKRYRVRPGEKPNILLDGSYKRKSIAYKNSLLKDGDMYEHTVGDVWRIEELTETTVTIAVIDKNRSIEDGSARTLKREVFAALIDNMYFSHTIIPVRIVGADISAAHMRDNFLRW